MDNIAYILYICFIIPMLLSLFILEKKSRRVVGFILVGTTICLFAAELNDVIYKLLEKDMLYFCTTISPVTEEILKALPVLYFAIFFSDERQKLVEVSFSVGLGFAILENMIMCVQYIDTIDIPWAIIRGFGAGLMHGVCTVAVGMGISYVKKKRKLFYCGTLALLMMAITYHAIYNTIVMSEYKYMGFVLPILTYIPIIYFVVKQNKKTEKRKSVKKA